MDCEQYGKVMFTAGIGVEMMRQLRAVGENHSQHLHGDFTLSITSATEDLTLLQHL